MTHLRLTLERWNRPSTYLILIMSLAFFAPALLRTADQYMWRRPWIMAEIQISPETDERGKPLIRYRSIAPRYVYAQWTAWVQVAGTRRCVGRGEAGYGPRSDQLVWSWDSFFERDCPVPGPPFNVCVQYDAVTPNDARGEFGPYCSDLYDPR